jgi:hypothetical protein
MPSAAPSSPYPTAPTATLVQFNANQVRDKTHRPLSLDPT